MKPLHIKMFGDFTLQTEDHIISDNDNRTKKIWILLAYLVCHRGRMLSQNELIKLLWGDEPASNNPENALRITLHRLRSQLDNLWPAAGHDIILYKDNRYFWNPNIPLQLDIDEFDRLCHTLSDDADSELQICLDAIALYRGDFLNKQSSESWVIPISTHFHNMYIDVCMQAIGLLSEKKRHREAIDICKGAISAEPYHEPLHQSLMKEYASINNPNAAAAVYEELSRKLFNDFGIRPSEDTRRIYREAVHSLQDLTIPLDTVLEHLQEPESIPGAMQCDYDYFKVLCYAESRAMERSGNATHVLLISVTDHSGNPLSRQSLGRIMNQFGEQIRLNLRRGDVFSRCSISQYIIMLPQANYENSCMVCRRLISAFTRKHPHANVRFNYMVQALSSGISVP